MSRCEATTHQSMDPKWPPGNAARKPSIRAGSVDTSLPLGETASCVVMNTSLVFPPSSSFAIGLRGAIRTASQNSSQSSVSKTVAQWTAVPSPSNDAVTKTLSDDEAFVSLERVELRIAGRAQHGAACCTSITRSVRKGTHDRPPARRRGPAGWRHAAFDAPLVAHSARKSEGRAFSLSRVRLALTAPSMTRALVAHACSHKVSALGAAPLRAKADLRESRTGIVHATTPRESTPTPLADCTVSA